MRRRVRAAARPFVDFGLECDGAEGEGGDGVEGGLGEGDADHAAFLAVRIVRGSKIAFADTRDYQKVAA